MTRSGQPVRGLMYLIVFRYNKTAEKGFKVPPVPNKLTGKLRLPYDKWKHFSDQIEVLHVMYVVSCIDL